MPFDLVGLVVAGLWATLLMTALYVVLLATQALHLDFGLLLGEMFLPRSRRSVVVGLILHSGFGVLFALAYGALFTILDLQPSPWAILVGAGFGIFHWIVSMPLIHLAGNIGARHRTADQPNPGEWGINYGAREAVLRLVGHVLYGASLALIYFELELAPIWKLAAGVVAVLALIGLIVLYLSVLETDHLAVPSGVAADQHAPPGATTDADLDARARLRRQLDHGEIDFAEYQRARRRYAGDP